MTIETRGTIELGDIFAVEYECRRCGAKSVRPIKNDAKNNVPVSCGNCNAVWLDGAGTAQELASLLNLIAGFRDAGESSSGFTLRFEVSGLDQLAAREKSR